jgi:hypothetical protein
MGPNCLKHVLSKNIENMREKQKIFAGEPSSPE